MNANFNETGMCDDVAELLAEDMVANDAAREDCRDDLERIAREDQAMQDRLDMEYLAASGNEPTDEE